MPLRPAALLGALLAYSRWYNTVRPHQGLAGDTPEERITGKRTAQRAMEVPPRYPVSRRGPRHRRRRRVEGPLELHVTRVGPAQLPVIELRARSSAGANEVFTPRRGGCAMPDAARARLQP